MRRVLVPERAERQGGGPELTRSVAFCTGPPVTIEAAFAVILPGVDETTALAVAERIRSRAESTLISLAPGVSDRISVSIGIACAPQHADDRITLLRLADEALDRAKEAERNRVVFAGIPEAPVAPAPEAAA
jgi:predicted signal transduction protein with EAL and GGDEF domain